LPFLQLNCPDNGRAITPPVIRGSQTPVVAGLDQAQGHFQPRAGQEAKTPCLDVSRTTPRRVGGSVVAGASRGGEKAY